MESLTSWKSDEPPLWSLRGYEVTSGVLVCRAFKIQEKVRN